MDEPTRTAPALLRVRAQVNGHDVAGDVPARLTLADFLRDHVGLRSVHLGCEQGICGACTVLIDGRSARSCLTLAIQADGTQISTCESLTEEDGSLGDLQEIFADEHALQCGYCTPGILMTVTELLAEERTVSEDYVRQRLSGNLCRCTGYVNIVRAVLRAASGGARGSA